MILDRLAQLWRAMTEPILTGDELDQAILAAARALIAARISRNPARITVAQAEYDRLVAMRYASV